MKKSAVLSNLRILDVLAVYAYFIKSNKDTKKAIFPPPHFWTNKGRFMVKGCDNHFSRHADG